MNRHPLLAVVVLFVFLTLVSCAPGSQPESVQEPSPEEAGGATETTEAAAEETAAAAVPEQGPPTAGISPEDPAVILLDPEAELEMWRDREVPEDDPPREPGPIRAGGALSFFGLPIAVTFEDLVAGEVDVAFFGAPVDMGVGYRGAGEGPTALRAFRRGGGSMETMVRWRSELNGVDFGNVRIDGLSVERSMPPIRRMVREIAARGVVPIIIGGDHSIEYPNVAGLADVYGKENVGVIHFDAHYDAGNVRSGHLVSHAQPVRRLVDDGHVLGENYIQVGLRGNWPGEEGFVWMRENNLRYHTMAEINRDGWGAVMKAVLDEANDGPEYLHISFDIDVMDPAYTSGTGTPVPAGLTPREVFPLIRGLCAENNVVGFDLVELNPLLDPGYTTVLNSKQVVDECLTGIAMKKLGLSGRDYLSPLTRSDGRR